MTFKKLLAKLWIWLNYLARGRVAQGVAALDEKVPGWDKRIDLTTLSLGSSRYCILGQLYSGECKSHRFGGAPYLHGLKMLDLSRPGGVPYGFLSKSGDSSLLDAIWMDRILERRAPRDEGGSLV